MFQSISILRNAILATALLALAASPAFAQRLYRGGYQDASGNYHSGNADFGSAYNGGYSSTPAYYPTDAIYLTSPYSYSRSYYTPAAPYYTPAASVVDNSATVQLHVPANAQVWFDNEPTRQTGTLRSYYTPQLDKGKVFHYLVRAKWDDNGKPLEKTKDIDVRAGQQTEVDFTK